MFDLNRRPILWAIVAPIQIKVVQSSLSYQQATYQKYDRRGQESPIVGMALKSGSCRHI